MNDLSACLENNYLLHDNNYIILNILLLTYLF